MKAKEQLVRMVNISKRFGRVQALKNVDFDVGYNEIVGLVGDNGAGKSTLINILSGMFPPSEGEIYFEGKKVCFSSPKEARLAGIETVYQQAALVDLMNISRNFFLGMEPVKRFGILDRKKMNEDCSKVLKEIGIRIRTPDEVVSVLSGGERQSITIGRALYFKAKLLLLDEPTAALSVKESKHVLERVKDLKKRGVSVVLIAHNIYHVYEVADKFVVLNHGIKTDTFYKKNVTPKRIMDAIVKSI
jgi:simple sugar transport system ATP-binding protein